MDKIFHGVNTDYQDFKPVSDRFRNIKIFCGYLRILNYSQDMS